MYSPSGKAVSSKEELDSYFKSPPKNCFDSATKELSRRSVKKVIEATIPTAKESDKNIKRSWPDLNSLKKIFNARETIVIKFCHLIVQFFDHNDWLIFHRG